MSDEYMPPCKDCADRAVGCHGTCGRYKEYKERYGRRVDELGEIRRRRRILTEYRNDTYRRKAPWRSRTFCRGSRSRNTETKN